MATRHCTNLALAYSTDGWVYGTDNRSYAGFAGGVQYAVSILRFDAPAIPGTVKNLNVSLIMTKGINSDVTLRWALCTSDANREKYRSTYGEVADENQIASGTIHIEGLTGTGETRLFDIPVENIGKGTWYLILWAGDEGGGIFLEPVSSDKGNYSVSIICTGGILWIKTAGGVKPFGVYNGERKRLTPYIKTESGIRPVN